MVTQVSARHLLVKNENECVKLKDIIVEKNNFVEMAKKTSLCPSGKTGGDLGYFGKGMMVPEFEIACFSDDNKIGDVVGPIKTDFGFHLIEIVDKK